jgi:hypothetical protein
MIAERTTAMVFLPLYQCKTVIVQQGEQIYGRSSVLLPIKK